MNDLIIIGGGYSVKNGISSNLWNNVKGNTIWALNRSIFTMPYMPDRLLWLDKSFYDTYKDKINQYDIELYTINDNKYPDRIKCMSFTTDIKDDTRIYVGTPKFTGIFALSLAVKENFNNIYLLGYDFGTLSIYDNKTHYYLDNNELLKNHSGAYKSDIYFNKDNKLLPHIKNFNKFKNDNIINVSPNSNINIFKKIDYEEFYKLIK